MTLDFLKKDLEDLEQSGQRRRLKLVESAQSSKVLIRGKEYLNFCSNNYLGLCDDDRLKKAAVDAIEQFGIGSGASRLVCGNQSIHERLENIIAESKGAQKCLVFSTGYMANVGIISSIFKKGDLILSDKLNHASIIDGIKLSGAELKRYQHCDISSLETLLEKTETKGKKCIITDSVFSMDGDIAPLDKIVKIAKKYNCITMVDEAHGFGVLGNTGMGAIEHFGLKGKIDIEMGTLSKAAGCFGAYVCGSKNLIDYLINKARSFIYTTGMPVSTCAAAIKAIEIIKLEKHSREKLLENANYLRKELDALGFNTLNSQTSIIPIIIGDEKEAVELSDYLFKNGILISAIRPPTVPANTSRLRVTLMATHTKEEMFYLLKCLNKRRSINEERQ